MPSHWVLIIQFSQALQTTSSLPHPPSPPLSSSSCPIAHPAAHPSPPLSKRTRDNPLGPKAVLWSGYTTRVVPNRWHCMGQASEWLCCRVRVSTRKCNNQNVHIVLKLFELPPRGRGPNEPACVVALGQGRSSVRRLVIQLPARVPAGRHVRLLDLFLHMAVRAALVSSAVIATG